MNGELLLFSSWCWFAVENNSCAELDAGQFFGKPPRKGLEQRPAQKKSTDPWRNSCKGWCRSLNLSQKLSLQDLDSWKSQLSLADQVVMCFSTGTIWDNLVLDPLWNAPSTPTRARRRPRTSKRPAPWNRPSAWSKSQPLPQLLRLLAIPVELLLETLQEALRKMLLT